MSTFYQEILTAMVDASVRFIVVGGVAVILHGVPRTTADLDLVLDLEPDNVDAFLRVVERLGFRPRAPVPASQLRDPEMRATWIRDKGMKAFTFVRGTGWLDEVDVLIDAPLDFAALRANAVIVAACGASIAIAGIDALIAMKADTGRAQDESDRDALSRLKEALGDR